MATNNGIERIGEPLATALITVTTTMDAGGRPAGTVDLG